VAAREVRETLRRVVDAGARVEYHACDVRDADAFGALVDGVYARHGRIDGAIHGAGVIEDRLLADKELASLERVVATKVVGARVLAERLRPESLRFLVLFSSVSGRFGNRGQADYAAASEVLAKLAQTLDRRWDARVVSIAWGPWLAPGGMVSDGVRRQFAERGVELIPVDVGCERLDQELRLGRKGQAEVVIGGLAASAAPPATGSGPARRAGSTQREPAAPLPLLAGIALARQPDGGFEALRALDPAVDRYLDDHRLDGRPVLPFAMALELMAEIAAAGWPALEVSAVHGVRMLRGVTVGDGPTTVRLAASPQAAVRGGLSVEVTISAVADPGTVHYRALVDCLSPGTDTPLTDALVPPLASLALPLYPLTVPAAYDAYLFHGPLFRGIVTLDGLGPHGGRGTLRASDPTRCVRAPDGARWLIDPVVVDSALQVQVLWGRQAWDSTLLPTGLERYERRARLGAPGEIVRHEFRIRAGTRPPICHADHVFLDADGRVLGGLVNMVGAGSKALNRLAGGSVLAGGSEQ
jgi:NAD(P)-dependent dehydrogenase (short-subunit alcohol dehydrogenase family)